MPHKFAFVMDPLENVLVDKDTTFVFMLEALRRGHEIYFLGLRDLYARGPSGHDARAAMRGDARERRTSVFSMTATIIRSSPSTPSSCARIRPPTRPICTPRCC